MKCLFYSVMNCLQNTVYDKSFVIISIILHLLLHKILITNSRIYMYYLKRSRWVPRVKLWPHWNQWQNSPLFEWVRILHCLSFGIISSQTVIGRKLAGHGVLALLLVFSCKTSLNPAKNTLTTFQLLLALLAMVCLPEVRYVTANGRGSGSWDNLLR